MSAKHEIRDTIDKTGIRHFGCEVGSVQLALTVFARKPNYIAIENSKKRYREGLKRSKNYEI